MYLAKPFAFILANLALANAAGCGDAQACIGTETCITVTRTAPSKTTITTCAPTPTCLHRAVHLEVVPNFAALVTARLPSVDQQIPSGQTAKKTWGIVNVIRSAVTTTSAWITSAARREFPVAMSALRG
ncbi:hypothetical protein AJ78_03813 [Emergomyces pasteurianus Ep9510]|uniref:Extracellular membrane protein CFEM domain-containing protein n=1 Tax=Emergomyces pasteurianus Ep9510 TaxID=1447872 RepID=A0A1J9QLA3_9EURO|nr:hypothetical protein AJ78_03813 [Emergomyces pasteurianus Ep9510]